MKSTFPLNGLVGRELGFNRVAMSSLNYKERLTKLTYRATDRLVVSPENPIYAMEFCPALTQPKILAVTDEIGGVSLIDTQTNGNSKVVAHHPCHTCSLYTVGWSIPRPNLLATGASDQTVCVWEANTFQKLITFTGHSKTVRRVRFHPTNQDLLGSCSRDGNIFLWDLRSKTRNTPMNTINSAHCRTNSTVVVSCKKRGGSKPALIANPLTDFLFVDDNTLISCAATDSQIKFWDIRKSYKYLQKVEPLRHLDYEVVSCTGYSAMTMDDDRKLYLSTAKNDIIRYQIYRDNNGPDAVYRRPSSDYSVNIGLSSDGRYLISGSITPHVSIWDTWDTTTQLPFVQLEGTRSEAFSVPCAQFAPNDPLKVVTGGDDSTLTIWRHNDPNCGTTTYSSGDSADVQLAPFNDLALPTSTRFAPKRNSKPVISCQASELLENLPNFLLDGRLPHLVSSQVRRPVMHTWLANFSLPKESPSAPIKKTIKLKRKMIQLSSPASPAAGHSKKTPKSGPPKKRQCVSSSRTSGSVGKQRLRKSLATSACNTENGMNADESQSILKYFSPIPSPSSYSVNTAVIPLRDMCLSDLDTTDDDHVVA